MTGAEVRLRRSAAQLLALVLDEGTFTPWDRPAQQPPAGPRYAAELEEARRVTGADESVITGRGLIRGRPVAVIVSEFGFLAGSIGRAASRRITDAVRRATEEGLPLLACPASGGTRMQEGTPAFLSMVDITQAIHRHKDRGLPYLVYLRHPTTGGVMASWGSLGHVTLAEPGALLGFLGPRVFEALNSEPFPSGVQTAENLHRLGIIDGVTAPDDLPVLLDRVLRIAAPAPRSGSSGPDGTTPAPASATAGPGTTSAWHSIERTRHRGRPDLQRLLAEGADDAVVLHGTGQGEADPGLTLALARFGTQPCVVVGHQRPGPGERQMGPASLRQARRGVQVAQELRLPLLTVIDTAGAELSREAEEGGLAGEIARTLADLIGTPAPSVSVLWGQGAGGGALALVPADRVIAAEHAWLSPLPPEGASAIVHRDTLHAAELAEAQDVNVAALHRIGLVDHVVPEEPAAEVDPRGFCAAMASAIEYELSRAVRLPDADRLGLRAARFDRLGC
ncbi:carboxyl transferase domain-containing protein [Citricoccus sp.]|uniref:carboxyl transferase domain-containing protein n=1 Tax=Citricoccus sp. TaxID=1978372 RepID=UPI0028BDC0EE|nr:carboxyl transferase domain-containing protein [Citricoccus sp.]